MEVKQKKNRLKAEQPGTCIGLLSILDIFAQETCSFQMALRACRASEREHSW
jgi:hypothetical protein